jgi:solute carrier family 66 (lysosomal lysine-arginine transporter), member 1
MSIDRTLPRYRTLSAVAANVAAAAALAAEHDELHSSRRGQSSKVHHSQESFVHVSRDTIGEEEDVPATLADSFISEGGLGLGRKQVSWSTERHGGRGGSVGRYSANSRATFLPAARDTSSSSNTAEAFLSRGRTLQRDVATVEPSLSSSISRASKARQGSGMVFLSVFAIFSLGSLAQLRSSQSGFHGNSGIGRVLSAQINIQRSDPIGSAESLSRLTSSLAVRSDISGYSGEETVSVSEPEVMVSETSGERILGRFFAWLCTTLYLTSRLPQIWKNVSSAFTMIFALLITCQYVRKSVEVSLIPSSTLFLANHRVQ